MASLEAIRKIQERGLLVSPEAARLDDNELFFLAEIAEKKGLIVVKPIEIEPVLEEKKEEEDIEELLVIEEKKGKRSYDDFVEYYNRRYEYLSRLLSHRPGLENVSSIARISRNGGRQEVAVIGMVRDIALTRNGNKAVVLEDPTGKITVFFSKNNEELFNASRDIVLDEVIGIKGLMSRNAIMASQLYFPGIPPIQNMKKSPVEEYILFLGDTHFGSALFLEKEFNNLLSWLRGEAGNEKQREIAEKIKYIVITGDIVEGIGIYPGQEEELRIRNIRGQFEEAARHLSRIPRDKKIIAIPGNHDPVRVEEPQPRIPAEYAEALLRLENFYMYTNPAWIRIGKKQGFEGFTMLLYHGSSLVYYADHIEYIRASGGQKRADHIMKLLLEKRHLAPTQGSNLFVPTPHDDYLLIKQVPDFFVTGHIHRVVAQNYKGISLINSSCWTGKSEDQERRGLEPQPARAIIANLKTRDLRILNFYLGQEE
ncbi:metallophosphoesterase [Candidatus Woesearchaeota archaeon]|nr:metallophosphoesterase [Candidatus Woesearchaeota archaeon]